MDEGLDAGLRNRLTLAALAEFALLRNVLQVVVLFEASDIRLLNDGSPLFTRGAYLAITAAPEDENAKWIWDSHVPNKVKIFAWLLFRDRLNTRANLLHKTLLPFASCARCQAP